MQAGLIFTCLSKKSDVAMVAFSEGISSTTPSCSTEARTLRAPFSGSGDVCVHAPSRLRPRSGWLVVFILLALDTIDFLFFFFCYNVFAQADASPFMVSLLMSSLSRSSFHEGCLHVVTDDFRHAIKLIPMAAQARVQSCMSQGYGAWYYDLQRKTFSVANGFDPYTL